MTKVICPYCQQPAHLTTGKTVHPHRPDLEYKFFWKCRPCNAWVGCHVNRNGQHNIPYGRLANAELRLAKQEAHAAFDPLWKKGAMSRAAAYAWLSHELAIPESECHIGMFDVAECRATILAVKRLKELSHVENASLP